MLLTWSPWRWEINILLTFPALTRLFWSWIWDPSPQSNIQDPSSTKKIKGDLTWDTSYDTVHGSMWQNIKTEASNWKSKYDAIYYQNKMIFTQWHVTCNIHMNCFKHMFRKTEIWRLHPTLVLRMAIKNLVGVNFRNNTLWFQFLHILFFGKKIDRVMPLRL